MGFWLIAFLFTEFLDQPSRLSEISVESLFLMAKLRLAIGVFGQEIAGLINRDQKKSIRPWLECLKKVTEEDQTETFKKYLVRVVVESTRQGCIETWKKEAQLRSLLPKDILSSGPDNVHDFYLFLELKNVRYRQIRDAIRHDIMSGKLENLPGLLRTYTMQKYSFVYQLALYNLFSVSKCTMKSEDVIDRILPLSQPLHDAVNRAVKSATEPKTDVNDEGLKVLIEHCRVVFSSSSSK